MNKNMTIEFSIEATIKQKIEIISDLYQEDEITELLEDGTLITSTWFSHKDKKQTYIEDHLGNKIAKIISQETEGSYFDFE
jgi:hypothetical protein